MTTDPYSDQGLVRLYDTDNPDGDDHAWYRELADALGARRILDLGCGTGLLTRSFVREGRSVTGVDPSATMLGFAVEQPGADAVTWVLGDAREIALRADLELVVCSGNAMMHIGPNELLPTLRHAAAGLRPGGVLAFETRNPAYEQWRGWTREATESERDTPLGWLREWIEVTRTEVEPDGQRLVSFDAHNVLTDGTDRVYTLELWFRSAATITAALCEAGFDEPQIDGGWAGEAVEDSSPLLVVQAARRA